VPDPPAGPARAQGRPEGAPEGVAGLVAGDGTEDSGEHDSDEVGLPGGGAPPSSMTVSPGTTRPTKAADSRNPAAAITT